MLYDMTKGDGYATLKRTAEDSRHDFVDTSEAFDLTLALLYLYLQGGRLKPPGAEASPEWNDVRNMLYSGRPKKMCHNYLKWQCPRPRYILSDIFIDISLIFITDN